MFLLSLLRRPRCPRSTSKLRRRPLTFEQLETRLAPANFVWTGAVNNRWSVGGNWQGGTAPATDGTAVLVFDTTTPGVQNLSMMPDLPTSTPIGGIEFAGTGGFLINGGLFNLAGNVTDSSTQGINTFSGTYFTSVLQNQDLTISATAGAHVRFQANQTIALVSSILNHSIKLEGAGQIDIQGIQFRNGSFLVSNVANGLINGPLTNLNQAGPTGGSVVIVNSGLLTLAGNNNDVTGNMVVNGGTLGASHNNAFGKDRTVAVHNAAAIELSNGIKLPNTLFIDFTAGGTLRNGDGSAVVVDGRVRSGTTTPTALTITGPNGGSLLLDEAINMFVPATTAPLNLTGNNFTVVMKNGVGLAANGIGDVSVGSGVTLQLRFIKNVSATPDKKIAIPAGLTVDGTVKVFDNTGQIAATSNVKVNSGGLLDLNGIDTTIASLSQTTPTGGQVGLGNGILTINNALDATFAGFFTGTGTLTKAGAGILTLTGSSPGFTGVNRVNAGTEIVNGSLGGPVIVSGGATFGGGGSVGTLRTSNTSEKVNPGPLGGSATGILKSGATTLDGNTTFSVLLNAAASTDDPQAGTDYDQLASSGAVDLKNATLNVLLGSGFGGDAGRLFTIVKGTSVTGTFNGLANGATITVAGTKFQITYDSTTVVLKEIGTATTTTLDIAYTNKPAPAVFGQQVTFTVNVSATTGGAPATSGTVTVSSGGTVLGTGTITNGQAVIQANSIPVGTYSSVVAHYSGGGAFEPSDSTPGQTLVVDKASTTVDMNPRPFYTITFGEKGELKGVVFVTSPGSGEATGTMHFAFSGGAGPVDPQDPTLDPAAVAFVDLSSLRPSATQYFVSAQYMGDDNFNASPVPNPGPRVAVTVNKANTSGIIQSIIPDPSTVGTPVIYTMILTVPPAAGAILAPTGTVEFFANGNSIGTSMTFDPVPGSNNSEFKVTLSNVTLAVGTYSITATYSGDSNYNMCTTTPAVDQTVNPLGGPGVAITAFNTPIVYGDLPQTYTATVTVPMVSSPAPTGLMTFEADGVTVLGSSADYTRIGMTNQYTVTISTSVRLNAGSHDIVAQFAGDGNYGGSSSPTVTQVVNRADTTTSLAPSSSTIVTGEPGSLVATVAVVSPGSGTPTENVKFVITGPVSVPDQIVPLTGLTASPNLSSLKPGTYMVTAQYLGDDNFKESQPSSPVTVVVTSASVEFSFLAVTPDPQEYNTAAPIYSLKLVVAAGGPAPTGTITILVDVEGTLVLVGTGDASQFTTTGDGVYTGSIQDTGLVLAPGKYDITGNYAGDGNYDMATAMTTREVVKTTGPTIAIGPPSVPTTTTGPVTYTVTYSDPFLETNSIVLAAANITLNATGTATGVVKVGKPVIVNGTTVTVNVAIASIKGNGTLGFSIGPNTATDQFQNLAGPAGPSTTFTVTGASKVQISYVNPPTQLRRSATTVLTIRVVNRGNQSSTGLFVTSTLPAFTTFNAAKSTPGWTQVSPGVFRLQLGTLQPGQARNVQFAVTTLGSAPLNTRVTTRASVFDATAGLLDTAGLALTIARKRWPSS